MSGHCQLRGVFNRVICGCEKNVDMVCGEREIEGDEEGREKWTGNLGVV